MSTTITTSVQTTPGTAFEIEIGSVLLGNEGQHFVVSNIGLGRQGHILVYLAGVRDPYEVPFSDPVTFIDN